MKKLFIMALLYSGCGLGELPQKMPEPVLEVDNLFGNTQEEIESKYGPPCNVYEDQGFEAWTYCLKTIPGQTYYAVCTEKCDSIAAYVYRNGVFVTYQQYAP
ncbi:hypothetical protein [Myxococcus phage Mx1]|nr:hypothetical protein [Myxococcus phage Mx1]